jgi:hypothetical protein
MSDKQEKSRNFCCFDLAIEELAKLKEAKDSVIIMIIINIVIITNIKYFALY